MSERRVTGMTEHCNNHQRHWYNEAERCEAVLSGLAVLLQARDTEDMRLTFYERDGLAYILKHIATRLSCAMDGEFLNTLNGAWPIQKLP